MIPLIPRNYRNKVVKPLHVKLLQHLTMREDNRYSYNCCRWYCQDDSTPTSPQEVIRVYDKSDLEVQHFSWGTWKERDPVCPDSCICNTGQRPLDITPIKRNKRCNVEKPLYKKVLNKRLMRRTNRYRYPCCEERCNLYKCSQDTERRSSLIMSGRRTRDRVDGGRRSSLIMSGRRTRDRVEGG